MRNRRRVVAPVRLAEDIERVGRVLRVLREERLQEPEHRKEESGEVGMGVLRRMLGREHIVKD